MGKNRKKDFFLFVLLFVLTIGIVFYALFLFYTSLTKGEVITFIYSESSKLDYKVYLQENEFYNSEYVGEEYNFVANAIDWIDVSFDYLLNATDYVQGKTYYTVNTKIVAYQKDDPSEKKIWDYENLIKDKTFMLYDVDTTTINVRDNFRIDYKQYKELMDNYRNKYAVSIVGNLIVEVEINLDLNYKLFKEDISFEPRKMAMVIPLTDPIVKISKTLPEDGTKFLFEKTDSKINYLKIGLSIFCFFGGIAICVYLGILLVKLLGVDSKYDRKLKKILKTYNSIIVNVEKVYLEKGQNVMNVSDFEELLDAQSELRTPILYCNIKTNKESAFYIKYGTDILVYRLKSDLYADNNKNRDHYEAKI